MKIAVCIKRTPDSESRFRIAAAGAAIDETGLKFDMDDFAGYAVEAALQINEKAGGGETVIYALGPDTVQESLRKAMSMGADRAVHLKTDTVPADGIAVAKALAAELNAGGYDLVLFGKHAFDTSAGVVGTATAELLGIPCVTAVSELKIENGKGTARRELEGAAELVTYLQTQAPTAQILGPAPAYHRKRKDWFQWQVIVKTSLEEQERVLASVTAFPSISGVQISVNVDPEDLG